MLRSAFEGVRGLGSAPSIEMKFGTDSRSWPTGGRNGVPFQPQASRTSQLILGGLFPSDREA